MAIITKSTTLFSLAAVKRYLKLSANRAVTLTSLTSSGLDATGHAPNHGFQDGEFVSIAGASPAAFNGDFTVQVLSPDLFLYSFAGASNATATGTISAVRNDDLRLATIANGVSERIEQYTSRVFVTRTAMDETWDGNGRPFRYLNRRPVLAISSLSVGGQVLAAADYSLDSDRGRIALLNGNVFGFGIANCLTVYDVGFGAQDADTLPADIYQAGLDYVKAVWDELTNSAIAATSVSVGGGSFVLKPGLPYGIRLTLDTWKELA